MKIALIYLGRRGGGAVYSLEVAKVLNTKVDLFAIVSCQVENLKAWRDSGINLLEVSTYSNVWEFFCSTLNFKKHFIIRKQLYKFTPDVIYYPMLHFWTPLINLLIPKVPKLITIHDPRPRKGDRELMHLIQPFIIRQTKRIILLSKSFIGLMEQYGVNKERIDVIPHGEFSYYKNISSKDLIRNQELTILFFGRITKYKGLDILLRAFPIIKKVVKDLRLLIVGMGDIKPYTDQLKILKDIQVVNHWIDDSEVSSYFTQASILVVPYIDATQSGVIPISYMSKVPVVATRVGGIPDQVENGKTGFLVDPGDVNALANACIKLLLNTSLRNKFGETAYLKAKNEWSWERIGDMVYKSCKKAINEKNITT